MNLEALDSHIQLLSLLWLFPVIFMFHDFEEILTVEKWMKTRGDGIFKRIPSFAQKIYRSSFQMNTLHFAKDVFWVYLIIVTVTAISVFFKIYLLFLMALHLFFIHVFTHVGQTLYFRIYTPGVVTSIILVLPYSVYTYYRLFAEQLINTQDIVTSALLLLIALPIALIILVKGRNRYVQ